MDKPKKPRKPRLTRKTTLRDSWVWNGTVEEFVLERIEGYSLNACAGKSPLGDVKIDLEPQNKSVQMADMRDLPFENCTFDTVIQDPPWKVGYYERFIPFYECARVCKVGGRIIYNAYWIPRSRSVELESVTVRQDTAWTNTSVISLFRKITAEFGDYRDKKGGLNSVLLESKLNG